MGNRTTPINAREEEYMSNFVWERIERTVGTLALVAFALLGYANVVDAHDSKGPYSTWMAKQRNKLGHPCCNGDDVLILEPGQWRIHKGYYEAWVDGKWIWVNDARLLDPTGGPNPTGTALVWYHHHGEKHEIYIRCFTSATEG